MKMKKQFLRECHPKSRPITLHNINTMIKLRTDELDLFEASINLQLKKAIKAFKMAKQNKISLNEAIAINHDVSSMIIRFLTSPVHKNYVEMIRKGLEEGIL
jgi:hypothetical protein